MPPAQQPSLRDEQSVLDTPSLCVRELAIGAQAADINMVSLVLVRAVVNAARTLGARVAQLETVRTDIDDPACAVSRRAFHALLRAISEHLEDPTVGVRLALQLSSRDLHFVGPLWSWSATMLEAIQRYHVARRIVLGGPAWHLERRDGAVVWGHFLDDDWPEAALEAQFFATLAYRLALDFLDPALRARVELQFAFAPVQALRAILPCAVRFDSPLNGVAMPAHALEHQPPGRDRVLADRFERFVARRFYIAPPSSWSSRVDQMLRTASAPYRVELEALAEGWNISTRSVRRHLEHEGTCFKDLRERVCMELAAREIATQGMRATRLTVQLGYGEVGSFRRAFRRHFGVSPAAYAREPRALAARNACLDESAERAV